MELDRRRALAAAGLVGAAAALAARPAAAAPVTVPHPGAYPPGRPGRDYIPVVTPNGVTLPFKIKDGVKVFHLVAQEVDHEFAPGLKALCWGYNGRCHGPTIEAVEGDRIRIYVTNKLPTATSIHWHGLILPAGMDGVAGLSHPPIPAGETWVYEFPLVQHGTHMYHSHHDEMTQIALGLAGLFIIHPRKPFRRVDRDFALLFSEWRVRPGARRPDPNEMTDFNVFSVNGKAFPGVEHMVVGQGQRVRIRLANISPMDHHPIHIHGHTVTVTATDGGPLPPSAQWPEVTVLTPVGSTRDLEFVADNPGDWAVHCHMTHHTMNQMGHEIPNMIGVDGSRFEARTRDLTPEYMVMGQHGMAEMAEMNMPPPANSIPMRGMPGPAGYIGMGGMFTVLKVRPGLTSYGDPGWWKHPPRTQAWRASPDELAADGVEV